MKLIIAMVMVLQSSNVNLPISIMTDKIIAIETMFTVSKKKLCFVLLFVICPLPKYHTDAISAE